MSEVGHSRRSDGQQGFADVRYAFNGDRILCVATNRRDVPISGHRRWRDFARELRAKLSPSGDQNGVLEYNEAQRPRQTVPL